MPFRSRMRKVFGSRTDSTTENGSTSPPKVDVYKPGEKIPTRYPGRYNKQHQDLLSAFSFVNPPTRRKSAQSAESPLGSRMPSRNPSRNPSSSSNILTEERTLEERGDQEDRAAYETDRPTSANLEAKLTHHERHQNLQVPAKVNGDMSGSTVRTKGDLATAMDIKLQAPNAMGT